MEHVPGLPPAAALYCMQIWTINFSHTQLRMPTHTQSYAGIRVPLQRDYGLQVKGKFHTRNSHILRFKKEALSGEFDLDMQTFYRLRKHL